MRPLFTVCFFLFPVRMWCHVGWAFSGSAWHVVLIQSGWLGGRVPRGSHWRELLA